VLTDKKWQRYSRWSSVVSLPLLSQFEYKFNVILYFGKNIAKGFSGSSENSKWRINSKKTTASIFHRFEKVILF
jgi:hypothetical protein